MKEFEYSGFPNGRIDTEAAIKLWEQGCTDAEIGEAFDVSKESAGAWRRRNGLKPNVKRQTKRKAGSDTMQRIAELNAEARAHGMTYGQWNGGGHGQTGH